MDLQKKDSGSYKSSQLNTFERDPEHFEADEPQVGVKTVEAAEKVYGKYSKWFLFIGYVMSRFSFSRQRSSYALLHAVSL